MQAAKVMAALFAIGCVRAYPDIAKESKSLWRGTLMFAISSCRHRNSLLLLQAVQHGRH
jgi:hypothetical protein